MGLRVALIDRDKVVQKMLSHCLHYFSAEVFRFDNLPACKAHFSDQKPDIVFVGWEMKEGANPLVHSITDELKPLPVVLLYRSIDKQEVSAVPSDKLPHKIEKPVNLQAVREKVMELIPKVKESGLHTFLEFPKTQPESSGDFKKVNDDTPSASGRIPVSQSSAKDDSLKLDSNNIKISTAHKKGEASRKSDRISISSSSDEESKEMKIMIGGTSADEEVAKTKSSSDKESIKIPSSSNEESKEMKIMIGGTSMDEESTKVKTSSDKESAEINIMEEESSADEEFTSTQGFIMAGRETTESKAIVEEKMKVDKENIDIDENTQNDLAPMAIKTAPGKKEEDLSSENIKLSDKDILRVLNNYKDTLGFRQIMTDFLAEQSEELVKNLLKDQKSENVLKNSLEDFKEGQKFKSLVQKEILQYVRKQLPLIIKEVVEQEIKKITES